jgi:hypothetical protein
LTTDVARSTKSYWRIRSSGAGGTSNWSDTWSFTTGKPPSAPVLVSPADNAVVSDFTPFLNWNNATNPVGTTFLHYQVQLDDNSDFSSPMINEFTTNGDITDSDFTPATDLPSNTKYYWRVSAINIVDGKQHQSGWSKRSFRAVPLSPTQILPANGVRVQ